MFGLSRMSRLFLTVLCVIVIPSLYLLYPSSDSPPRDGYGHATRLQAGGIDSDHWRNPIWPKVQHDLREGEEWGGDIHVAPEDPDWGTAHDHEVVDDSVKVNLRETVHGVTGTTGTGTGMGMGSSEVVLGTQGGVIMPKMENATAKAELGRAAWRVIHLMTLRYPEKPTPEDRDALKSYFHLFSRLYPCGECAEEFQKLLKEYPPQTSSRKSASMWLCFIHNLVNERLGKPEFDCLTLDKKYDCGCGPEGALGNSTKSSAEGEGDGESRTTMEDLDENDIDAEEAMERLAEQDERDEPLVEEADVDEVEVEGVDVDE